MSRAPSVLPPPLLTVEASGRHVRYARSRGIIIGSVYAVWMLLFFPLRQLVVAIETGDVVPFVLAAIETPIFIILAIVMGHDAYNQVAENRIVVYGDAIHIRRGGRGRRRPIIVPRSAIRHATPYQDLSMRWDNIRGVEIQLHKDGRGFSAWRRRIRLAGIAAEKEIFDLLNDKDAPPTAAPAPATTPEPSRSAPTASPFIR